MVEIPGTGNNGSRSGSDSSQRWARISWLLVADLGFSLGFIAWDWSAGLFQLVLPTAPRKIQARLSMLGLRWAACTGSGAEGSSDVYTGDLCKAHSSCVTLSCIRSRAHGKEPFVIAKYKRALKSL